MIKYSEVDLTDVSEEDRLKKQFPNHHIIKITPIGKLKLTKILYVTRPDMSIMMLMNNIRKGNTKILNESQGMVLFIDGKLLNPMTNINALYKIHANDGILNIQCAVENTFGGFWNPFGIFSCFGCSDDSNQMVEPTDNKLKFKKVEVTPPVTKSTLSPLIPKGLKTPYIGYIYK